MADVEPTAAALRQALALAHSAAADGPYGPREQVHPAAPAGRVSWLAAAMYMKRA